MIELGKRWGSILADVPETRKDETVVSMPSKARENLMADIDRKKAEIKGYKEARRQALAQIEELRQRAERAATLSERELRQARDDLHAMQDILAKVMVPYFEEDDDDADYPVLAEAQAADDARSTHGGD